MSDQGKARNGGNHDAAPGGTGAPAERTRRSCGGEGGKFEMDAWWEDRSLPEKIALGIGFGILGLGLIALCGWVLMLLWNWLMPEIFGLGTLNYWQAWGLLALSTILFKGFGSGANGGKSDRKRKKHLRRYIREEQSSNGKP